MLSFRNNSSSIITAILGRLRELQPGGDTLDKAMHAASAGQLSACIDRIHVRGLASDGTDIGQYSTTPIYVNPAKGGRFQPEGKAGRTVFASTGQPHLTKYFDQGYRAYREAIGLPADKVTLTLRGDLRDDLSVRHTAEGYGLGWDDERLQERAEMLEQKYGKQIWAPTAEERAVLTETIRRNVGELLK